MLIDLGRVESNKGPVCFKIPFPEWSQYGNQVSTKATDEGSEMHVVSFIRSAPYSRSSSAIELRVRSVVRRKDESSS